MSEPESKFGSRVREFPQDLVGASETASARAVTGSGMVRISAIFIALCMVLIAASLGIVLYLRFGFAPADAALVALGVLTALAIYNAVAGRKRDRAEVSDQVSNLARGSGDLARHVGEFGRRLSIVETKVESVIERAMSTAQPLAAEIEELSRLVRQLAEFVAVHDIALGGGSDFDDHRTQAGAAEATVTWPAESACRAGRFRRAQSRRLQRARPRRHHRPGPQRHRSAADRSLSAADRDLAAAQGALL